MKEHALLVKIKMRAPAASVLIPEVDRVTEVRAVHFSPAASRHPCANPRVLTTACEATIIERLATPRAERHVAMLAKGASPHPTGPAIWEYVYRPIGWLFCRAAPLFRTPPQSVRGRQTRIANPCCPRCRVDACIRCPTRHIEERIIWSSELPKRVC